MRVDRATLGAVERALQEYAREVERAPLARTTKNTYVHHAETFVRWLAGDFEPGANRKGRAAGRDGVAE